MKKIIIIFFISIIYCTNSFAQYYDTLYIKDLKNRMMFSYFQEYKTFEINLIPDKSIDSTNRESLKLKSDALFYSGVAFQFKDISLVFASTLPQTDSSKRKYGEQNSQNIKLAYQNKGLALNANYIGQRGFYDENFNQHQYAPQEDANAFNRFNNMQATWVHISAKYYPEYKKFAIGLPNNFGIKQIKTKFSWAYRVAYNYIKYSNDRPLFSEKMQSRDFSLGVYESIYNSINFSVSPSIYVANTKGWFLYADVWLGTDIGVQNNKNVQKNNQTWQYNIVVPELKIMGGYQGDRFLACLHYNYINQTFKSEKITNAVYYHTFSFILGYRIFAPVRLLL